MGRFIDWYAVELDGYLKGRMGDEQRFDAVRELQNHFAEHVDDLVQKGMDAESAEKSAIRTFGPPNIAAQNLLPLRERPKLGNFLVGLACIAIVFSVWMFAFFANQVRLQSWDSFRYVPQIFFVTGVSLAIGFIGSTLAKRRVATLSFLAAWVIGLILGGAFLTLTSNRYFANIPPSEVPEKLKLWKSGNESTAALSKDLAEARSIVSQFSVNHNSRSPYSYEYRNGHAPSPEEKSKAIARLQEIAQHMISLKPAYVAVGGTQTTGYLVPRDGLNEFGNYYGLHAESFRSPTGPGFPFLEVQLAYVKSDDQVLEAWQDSESVFYGTHEVSSMVNRQEEFIQTAAEMQMTSRATVVAQILMLTASWTFLVLASCLFVCWILTKIPRVRPRRSYKRIFA